MAKKGNHAHELRTKDHVDRTALKTLWRTLGFSRTYVAGPS